MKGIEVLRGHSKDPDEHCFDGDSTYVTGSYENTLVRLLGIDALEIRGLSLYYLEKSGFLDTLDRQLWKYLKPKLTDNSIQTHKKLGFEAREYLNSILEEELMMSFDKEVFDRYGRALVYLSPGDGQDTYNFKLVESGYAIPYFIYSNAVSPTEDGEWDYSTIRKMRNACIEAQEDRMGIWEYMDDILLPMELRFLTRREPPQKYCADLVNDFLYSPQHYHKVSIENRLFFYPRDVLTAIQQAFRPTHDCPEWLHKAWKVIQAEDGKRGEQDPRRKRREELR